MKDIIVNKRRKSIQLLTPATKEQKQLNLLWELIKLYVAEFQFTVKNINQLTASEINCLIEFYLKLYNDEKIDLSKENQTIRIYVKKLYKSNEKGGF